MAGWKQRPLHWKKPCADFGLLVLAAVVVSTRPSPAEAQVAERFSVDQRGDFVLVGNTLALDCAIDPDLLLVGDAGNCGSSDEDSGADVLWSVAVDGTAPVANVSVGPEQAASIAVLDLPDGASVTRAELYWSAQTGEGDASGATFGRGAAAASISAARTSRSGADGDDYYQSVAEVTALVRELGAGPYRLSGIDAASPVGLEDTTFYAGWWLVVFYALDSEPVRHLALYDGFGFVTELAPSSATLTGFEVPLDGADGKLAAVAFDGDATADGDQLRFGPRAPLGAAARLEASNNFFDGSRRDVTGEPFSAAGDRPRASGDAGSMSGVDLHVVDVGARLEPGQTTAEVLATTTADRFFLSGLVLSVATTAPDLSLSTQSVRDVNGPPLRPGDELEYTVVADNVGTGAAPRVTLRAPLPAQVTFVPGSLEIIDGTSPGLVTDAADADRGELELGAAPALVVRLGDGADASGGGRLAAGESSSVRYRVALVAGASGSIVSQAQLGVARAPGSEAAITLTDASLEQPGPNPTVIEVDGCASDVDCSAGFCDVGQSPQRCVECLVDAHCSGLEPSCGPSRTCACVPIAAIADTNAGTAGDESRCDGRDDDCDGAVDEGLAGVDCNAGSDACSLAGVSACDAVGGVRCDASGPAPAELCSNGVDDDCDGATDTDDDDCAPATAPADGSSASAGSDGPLVPEPSTETPVAPRPAPPVFTPVPGNPSPSLGSPSAASLGGGGGCQLQPNRRASLAPGLLLAAALLVRRRRRAAARATAAHCPSRHCPSRHCPSREVGSPPTQTLGAARGSFKL
jgi:uncharacterized repeat protein (TIGR01451 family)